MSQSISDARRLYLQSMSRIFLGESKRARRTAFCEGSQRCGHQVVAACSNAISNQRKTWDEERRPSNGFAVESGSCRRRCARWLQHCMLSLSHSCGCFATVLSRKHGSAKLDATACLVILSCSFANSRPLDLTTMPKKHHLFLLLKPTDASSNYETRVEDDVHARRTRLVVKDFGHISACVRRV